MSLFSLICPCFVVVYLLFIFISFTRPLFSLFSYIMLFVFFSSVSVFTCFVCFLLFLLFWLILNLEKGFCCLFLMCYFNLLCPRPLYSLFLSVLVVCLFLLFYSLFLFLLSPLYSSVFTFHVFPYCCFIFCLIYYLF